MCVCVYVAEGKIVSGRGWCGKKLWIAKPVTKTEKQINLSPCSVRYFPIFFYSSHFNSSGVFFGNVSP